MDSTTGKDQENTMKILLVAVNAKYIHSNLAVYSLRAYAKEYEDVIELAEFTINHSTEDILKGIYQQQADVIAFSCYIWNIDLISKVIVELKKVQPAIKIWFGGPEVSYDARQCLETHKELDGIIIGEGEQIFLELTGYYVDRKKELSEISGLAFRDSANSITITSDRPLLSLEEIPFPYTQVETFRNKIIYYESSRGCPFSCSYCLSSIDKRVRLRDTELVKRELKFFFDYKVLQVKFVDRTFNCNKKHAMDIWRFIKEQDNGITNFHFEISADLLGEEEIEFLATLRPGQVQLEIGVQTTNPDTLAIIHRKTDFDKLSNNVRRIQAVRNIHQHLDLIAGLPLEDYTSFANSFNEVYRLKPDQLQLGFLKVLKGSGMEEESKNYGIVHQGTPPYEVLFTDQLPYPDLLRLKGVREMVEAYYNSGQFTYSILFLEHFFQTPMLLYQALDDYYRRKWLDQLAHNRSRRYEILLDFYREIVLILKMEEEKADFTALFLEILVLDLYLREDMKSRPQFVGNIRKPKNSYEIYDTLGIDRDYAHMEYFNYDVFASCETGQPVKKDMLLVFDYSNRDILNKAAKLIIVEQTGTEK